MQQQKLPIVWGIVLRFSEKIIDVWLGSHLYLMRKLPKSGLRKATPQGEWQ